jgi:hypothetical protein
MNNLFQMKEVNKDNRIYIGADLFLEITKGYPPIAYLYVNQMLIKKTNLEDKVELRLLVVDAVERGAKKVALAEALGISRQTIHNYEETKKYFGLEGLINSYKHSDSKSMRKQRQLHPAGNNGGNKAQQVAKIRKEEREKSANEQRAFEFEFEKNNEGQEQTINNTEQPFAHEHDWLKTRYAGIFSYIIVLISRWKWLRLVTGIFGSAYKIFMVFLLMAGLNIRSIEQMKNIRSREAGLILGLKRIPSLVKIREWFYNAADKSFSPKLLKEYFRFQLLAGLVGVWIWFTDGHFLPYTGKSKVHYSYSTQRRMPMPGQTNMVSCDSDGCIVDFDIQEGKGDFRSNILSLAEKWSGSGAGPDSGAGNRPLNEKPVMVFDREGYSAEFFSTLVKKKIPFVTWEKYADATELNAIDENRFVGELTFNGTVYRFFEVKKSFQFPAKNSDNIDNADKSSESDKSHVSSDFEDSDNTASSDSASIHHFNLRHFYIWNQSNNHRTSGLAWTNANKDTDDADDAGNAGNCNESISSIDCIKAILSRWGASENTFKHIKNRHPFHYHPGFKLVTSDNQLIANPVIKEKEALIKELKKKLKKNYKKLAKSKETFTKKGEPRKNNSKKKLEDSINKDEHALKCLVQQKGQLPEKVDVSTLEDYKSFKRIDNEGKNLFDFVTTSVWNARKKMVNWLKPFYKQDNEVVDLFYAITDCHGWVKSTATEVIVRLEPLQQPKRRASQEQLCRILTFLNAKTLKGKRLRIEVGEDPTKRKKCPKI